MEENKELTFMHRVMLAQSELKCNKSQYNSFGKYHYRSCEDILEAAKPICKKYGLLLILSDRINNIGERYYVEATATLRDTESGAGLSSTASAREPSTKKGMDESQITGTASSYARKYALNGLFDIDDTKDADTDEYTNTINKSPSKVYKCAECGTEFKSFKTSNGKFYSAEDVYNINKSKSVDGIVRCKACREKVENKLNEELNK